MDESRQQETQQESFVALLREAAEIVKVDDQVLMATSQQSELLSTAMSGVLTSVVRRDNYLLKPLQE
jgi:hypothetical protein